MAWYEAKTGNSQCVVVDEKTGANIAVVYDKTHAPLIAQAPAMAEALRRIYCALQADAKEHTIDTQMEISGAMVEVGTTLAEIEGKGEL